MAAAWRSIACTGGKCACRAWALIRLVISTLSALHPLPLQVPQAMAPGAFATTALARHPLPTLQAEGAGSRAAGPFLLGDSLMEASRPELRSVFDADSWEALRCTDRYFHHILETHRRVGPCVQS